MKDIKKVLETGQPIEYEDVDNPGKPDLKINFKAFRMGDHLGIIGRDVTELVKTRESLLESEEKFSAAFSSSPIMSAHKRYVIKQKKKKKGGAATFLAWM